MATSGHTLSSRPSFSFDGIKFWISIFAPQRIKPLVKKHNGIVVQSESDADIFILDPKRAASRPGISHVWIEDCVRSGRKIDEERYLIVPPDPQEQARTLSAARSISASQTAANSRRRNLFTAEDDRILIQWLRREQRIAGRNNVSFSINGNAIYKSLAEVPSQPSPSPSPARQRVARRPARLPARTEEPAEEEAYSQEEAPAEVEAPIDVQVPAENGETPDTRAADDTEQEAEPVRLFFMQKPHYFIVKRTYEHYLAAKKGSIQSEAEFFESLHKLHPSVTPDDWREEYSTIKSWYEDGLSQRERREAGAPGEIEADPPVATEEIAASQPAQTAQDGNTVLEVQVQEQEPTVDADLDLDDDAILDGINSQLDKQQEFLGKLEVYNDYTGVYVPPSFFIGGRYLETCSLWFAVEEQGVSLEDVDWPKIAASLGFKETGRPSLWKQLAGWFHQNLKEFDKILEQMINEAEGEEEDEDEELEDDEEEDEEEEDVETGNREDVEVAAATEALGDGDAELSESQPLPQQKPMGIFSSAKKRLLAIAFPNSDPVDNEAGPTSPSKRVRFSAMPATINNDAEGDDDDDDFEPPRTRSAAHPTPAEPETQDFAYSEESQQAVDLDDDLATREDADAAGDAGVSTAAEASTPSQQLHTEDVVVPTPRTLPGRRTRGQTPTASQPAAQRAATTPRRTRQNAGASKQRRAGKQQQALPFAHTIKSQRLSFITGNHAEQIGTGTCNIGNDIEDAGATQTAVLVSETSAVSLASNTSAIDRFVALRYPEDTVVRALWATGGTPGLAGVVMEELLHGRGMPQDMSGVWTSSDDRMLEHAISGSAAANRSRHRAALKHGEEQVVARQAFLAKERARKARRRRRLT
ncbi:transcription factor [Ophiostoma piceae UAMH 11346]|uniref:DNA-binding protein RAP1 n=1 Tax=Ophiostoma piceae (strain UAMH 11346) TaxID=1262450 RepID=S3BUZ0_OPHP1|nr:transcription factor [Ophiostoma piceae UAMH 11346]